MVMEAYITCEKEPGGDWYNLVILSEEAAVEDFTRNNSTHSKVVVEVAPLYYSHVRIHRGTLDIGGDGGLVFNRTLSLRYKDGQVANREIVNW